jgi:hypothetical protein
VNKAQRDEILRLGRQYAEVMAQGQGATVVHPVSPILRACVFEAGAVEVSKWAMHALTTDKATDTDAFCAILGACFTAMAVGGVGSITREDA